MHTFNPTLISSKDDIPEDFKFYYRNSESINKVFDTIAIKNNNLPVINTETIIGLSPPHQYSVVGENCKVVILENNFKEGAEQEISHTIEVKSFYYFKLLDYVIYYLQLLDGRVIDVNDYPFEDQTMTISLCPYSLNYMSVGNYKTLFRINRDTTKANINKKTDSVISSMILNILRNGFFEFLRTLNPDCMKLLYRTRSYSNDTYNMLVDSERGLYRRQFLRSYPSTGFLFKNSIEKRWIDRIDATESGISILNDYYEQKYKANIISYALAKTPHSYIKTDGAKALEILNTLDRNFWPKKKTEWPYVSMFSEISNKMDSEEDTNYLNNLSKKYKIANNNWTYFKKFGTPEFIKTSITNCINDVISNNQLSALREVEEFLPIVENISTRLKSIMQKNDLSQIIDLNNFFHNTQNRALNEASHIIESKLGIVQSHSVSEVVFSEKFIKNIETTYSVTIRQLMSENDFIDEGMVMSHCVRGYYASSLKGRNLIFSLQKSINERSTVEISISDKEIKNEKQEYSAKVIQNRSYKNTNPSENLMHVGEQIAKYLSDKKQIDMITKIIEEGKSKVDINSNYKLKNAMNGACIINVILYPFLYKKNKEVISTDKIFKLYGQQHLQAA